MSSLSRPTNLKRVHVWISGRVQGVFFRWETMKRARALGVRGWVRNLSDGRVEAVFEGSEEAVEQMLEFCREGPPAARVTKVEAREEPYRGEFSDFRILH